MKKVSFVYRTMVILFMLCCLCICLAAGGLYAVGGGNDGLLVHLNFDNENDNLVNGQRQEDGTIRSLTPRQVANLPGHSTSQITEMYYVKKDTSRLNGITDGFEM